MRVGFENILIAIIGLAIVAVVVSNGQAAALVGALGNFLASMVGKVENA